MAFNLKEIFSSKKTTTKEDENKNFNAIPVMEKTPRMDLALIITKRANLNLEKYTDKSKLNEDIEKYGQMAIDYKKRGATERQLTNLRDKKQELIVETQKIDVLTELLNQDNLVKTAYGKKRQAEIYSTLINRYKEGSLNLIDFKETLQELSIILKSRTDERNETQKLEDFNAKLF